MRQLKSNKGFGLVECVVAMFLMCIVLLGIGSHIGVTMKAMQQDRNTSVASALLQDRAEAIKQTPYASISTGTDTVIKAGSYYVRNWNVTTNGNMKTVALSIAWGTRLLNTTMIVTQ